MALHIGDLKNTTEPERLAMMAEAGNDERERAAILTALDRWIRQRPGLEYANYGNPTSYRSELRSISRDGREAKTLLQAVRWREQSITLPMLREAFRAYSGRLTWTWDAEAGKGALSYVTGQYWPTEYRKAACAVLASALWAAARESMPAVSGYQVQSWTAYDTDGRKMSRHTSPFPTREAAEAALTERGGHTYGHVQELHNGQCPGDWLRSYFRREFGRGLASRWFA